jgi:predicted cobalt transporter CbtA
MVAPSATGSGLALQHRGAPSVVVKQATESDEARQPRDGVAPCLLTLGARLTFLLGQVALLPGVQASALGQDEESQQELVSGQRICLPQGRTGFL